MEGEGPGLKRRRDVDRSLAFTIFPLVIPRNGRTCHTVPTASLLTCRSPVMASPKKARVGRGSTSSLTPSTATRMPPMPWGRWPVASLEAIAEVRAQ